MSNNEFLERLLIDSIKINQEEVNRSTELLKEGCVELALLKLVNCAFSIGCSFSHVVASRNQLSESSFTDLKKACFDIRDVLNEIMESALNASKRKKEKI